MNLSITTPTLTTILESLGVEKKVADHISTFCHKWYPTTVIAGIVIIGGNEAVKLLITKAPDANTLVHLSEFMTNNGISVDDNLLQKTIQALIPV